VPDLPGTTAHTRIQRFTTLRLDARGWLLHRPGVRHAPSPNFDTRPRNAAVTLLVLHNISLPPGQFGGTEVVDFFQNCLNYNSHPWLDRLRELKVSAHFFVRRTGEIVQLVSTCQRAWHAGVSSFRGKQRCNDFSVGIELEGTDDLPYTQAQYSALRALTTALRARHPLRAVHGHQHIAPGRKTDPGPAFNWQRYARENSWQPWQLPL
jgi:AmpD protein